MIFVTGGTGLVGSHLLYALTSRGKKVRALYRSKSNISRTEKIFGYYTNKAGELLQHIEWVQGELADLKDSPELLEGIEEVYHCAAMVSFEGKNKKAMLHNNIEGTACMVNACLERKDIRLCFVSSVAALGAPVEEEMVTENHMWKPSEPHSAYSLSKFHSEMEVWRGISEGLQAVIVNPSIILGPGNWHQGSSVFFPICHKGLRFYTSGVTGFVDVRDVVACMILLMEQKVSGERFILNSENLSYRDLFTMLARAFDRPDPDFYVSRPLGYLAVFGSFVAALFTGKQASLTRETLQSAYSVTRFSNQRITEHTGYAFRPVIQSVKEIAPFYLQYLKNK